MSLFHRLINCSNVSYCQKNLALNYNELQRLELSLSIIGKKYFINMAYDLVLYSVLVNMNPVNKLYLFDWIILINAEYVVYIMCVCLCVDMYVV